MLTLYDWRKYFDKINELLKHYIGLVSTYYITLYSIWENKMDRTSHVDYTISWLKLEYLIGVIFFLVKKVVYLLWVNINFQWDSANISLFLPELIKLKYSIYTKLMYGVSVRV